MTVAESAGSQLHCTYQLVLPRPLHLTAFSIILATAGSAIAWTMGAGAASSGGAAWLAALSCVAALAGGSTLWSL